MPIHQGLTSKGTAPEETTQVARKTTRNYQPAVASYESLQCIPEESHSPSVCPSFVTNMDAYRETIKRGKEIMEKVRVGPYTLRGRKCLPQI